MELPKSGKTLAPASRKPAVIQMDSKVDQLTSQLAQTALEETNRPHRSASSPQPSRQKSTEDKSLTSRGRSRSTFAYSTNLSPAKGESLTLEDVRAHAPEATETDYGVFVIPDASLDQLKKELTQINLHENGIKEHLDRRVQLFYLQLVACHQTGLKFDFPSSAPDQADYAIPLDVETEQHTEGLRIGRRHAAHSSIIATLLVTTNTQTQFYLYDTDFYRACNATISLPRFVNLSIDKVIEGTKTKGLRPICLSLLNKAAQNQITSDKALVQFVDAIIKQVTDYQLKAGKERDIQKKPLKISLGKTYYNYLMKWQSRLKLQPTWFSQLLCGYTNDDANLRERVYSAAQAVVRARMNAMCELGKIIRRHIGQELAQLEGSEFFHDNFLDFLIGQLSTREALQQLIKQYYCYPGELHGRRILKRYREDQELIPANERVGGLVYGADGEPEYVPLWNEALQNALYASDIRPLIDAIDTQYRKMWEEEFTHRANFVHHLKGVLNLDKEKFEQEDAAIHEMLAEPAIHFNPLLIAILSKEINVHESLFYLHFQPGMLEPSSSDPKSEM